MKKTLRITVTATLMPEGWRFGFTAAPADGWSRSNVVAAFAERPWLPRPTRPCTAGCDHAWCINAEQAHVESALGALRRRSGDGGIGVGRWLYDVLLAPVRSDLDDLAALSDGDIVELALTWPYPEPDDEPETRMRWTSLSSLPWELMRDDSGPLAVSGADGRLAVAVTRVVSGTRSTMSEVAAPPKVLFVLGAAITDDSVRAGAEVLGLLREVEASGRRVNHRILDRATPTTLRRAVAAFQPDVVHLICHGGTDSDGLGYLRLISDEPGPGNRGSGSPRSEDWTGKKLLEHLRLKNHGRPPPIVVLSACESAGDLPGGRRATALGGPQLAAPLAVELVRGGVPVVVAMAGTIADRACRVFTRHFGRALADGHSLVEATADARRLAFAELPGTAIDWALPAVFLSAGVESENIRAADDPTCTWMTDWSDVLQLKPLPLFCARERILSAFWSMLPGGRDADRWHHGPEDTCVLILSTPEDHKGIGKTRMLEEIARQAFTNGCIPLLIRPTPDASPRDVQGLAKLLADALDVLVRRDMVADSEPTELRWLERRLAGAQVEDGVHRGVADELGRDEWQAMREALRLDAATVLESARTAHPGSMGANARLVVLLDNLGQTSVPLLKVMFGPGGIDRHGIGRKAQPVPLVAVLLGTGDDIRRDVRDRTVPAAQWIDVHPLEAFSQFGDEDLLAYESVLLYPFRGAEGDIARTPWVFNRGLDTEQWDEATAYLRRRWKGLPGSFGGGSDFEGVLDAVRVMRLLAPADDWVAS